MDGLRIGISSLCEYDKIKLFVWINENYPDLYAYSNTNDHRDIYD